MWCAAGGSNPDSRIKGPLLSQSSSQRTENGSLGCPERIELSRAASQAAALPLGDEHPKEHWMD
jgi:hypothetical protein